MELTGTLRKRHASRNTVRRNEDSFWSFRSIKYYPDFKIAILAMIFEETELKGVYLIEPERFEDERGFFAPSFSQREFETRGMIGCFVENNISYNLHRGTLRGLHYQRAPYGQAKLVRCTRGAIFDVAVDLRPESPTFRKWVGFELTAENRLMMYLPGDMAHGFQTLEDDTEVFYQASEFYAPQVCMGWRWNDPAFGIEWPLSNEPILLTRDASYPDFPA